LGKIVEISPQDINLTSQYAFLYLPC